MLGENLELEVEGETVLVGSAASLLAFLGDGAGSLRGEGDGEGVGELVLEGDGNEGLGGGELSLEGGLGVEGVAEGSDEAGEGSGLGGVDDDLSSSLGGALLVEEGGTSGGSLLSLVEGSNQGELLRGHIAELEAITAEGEGLVGHSHGGQSVGSSADRLVSQSQRTSEAHSASGVRDAVLNSHLILLVQEGHLLGGNLSGLGDLALRVDSHLQTSDSLGLIRSLNAVHGDVLVGLGGGLQGHAIRGLLGGLEQGVQRSSGVGSGGLELLLSRQFSIDARSGVRERK